MLKNVSSACSNVSNSSEQSPLSRSIARRREKYRKLCAYCASVYFFFTAFMLLNPQPPVPEIIEPTLDFIHFGAFSLLGTLVGLSRRRERSLLFWFVALLIWGVGTEFIQPYVGRFFEWIDVAQNAVGVVLGLAAATWARRFVRRRFSIDDAA